MKELIESMGTWGVPTIIISVVIGVFLVMQVTGEIIEWCGKTAPVWLKIRKLFTKRKDERLRKEAERDEALRKATNAIETFNHHYDPEAINARNTWMQWVNARADVYDASVQDLIALKELIESHSADLRYNSELTCQMYKDFNRNRILDFAHALANTRKADKPVVYSREEFRKIHAIHEDYEAFLRKYGGTNGEVDDAMKLVRKAEAGELPNIEFLEDLRD